MEASSYTIRKGKKEDIQAIFHLVEELAVFEKAENELVNTPERMMEDAFGDKPVYEFFVACYGEVVVGMTVYFYNYSTWKGKFLYMDDLIITQSHRGKGLGKKLLDSLVLEAKNNNANRVGWQVLNWNDDAINFYKILGASFDNGWTNCRLWVDRYLENHMDKE